MFESVHKRRIDVREFGQGKRAVLIMAGVHGDESTAVQLARQLMRELSQLPIASFTNRVVVMPLVNPDGYHQHTRSNARGIDINRNFPTRDFGTGVGGRYYGGKKPFSEPETSAIRAVVDYYDPKMIISLHAPLGCVNYDGPAEMESQQLAKACVLPVRKSIGYKTPGSMGEFYGVAQNLPVITLELPARAADLARYGRALLSVLGVRGPPRKNAARVTRIVVSKSQQVLLAYLDGGKQVRAYLVSTGASSKWTPIGSFRITGKTTHPGKRDLGTRWMAINWRHPKTRRQYGIHGTNEPQRIGHRSSRGCIRLLNRDAEDLYELTPVGTSVMIVDNEIADSDLLERLAKTRSESRAAAHLTMGTPTGQGQAGPAPHSRIHLE